MINIQQYGSGDRNGKTIKNIKVKEKFVSRIYAHKKVHLRIETGGQESDGGKTVSHIRTRHTKEMKKREKSQEYM